MGTHPIFESDFDCLTELTRDENFTSMNNSVFTNEKIPVNNPIWPDDIVEAHFVSSISLFVLFGIVSLGLFIVSFLNGWRVLNKGKHVDFRQIITCLFLIGSFVSPIFGRFFRSSLDFKYFFGLVDGSELVYEKVTIPNSLTMNVYAISIFGTSVTLPIMLIIFKYSDQIESYHPTVTKVRILLAITMLHLLVDIPTLICEYFYVDKYIVKQEVPVFVPMKSILHVIENLFATISIVMVEFRSPTLQNLDLAERVMIMRFALLGILLYLGANIIRCTLTLEQIYVNQKIDMSCLTDFDSILVASPFNKMCLNYAEIIMMTLVALSVLVAMIVLISNLVLFQRLNNYRSFIETQNNAENQSNDQDDEQNNHPPAIND